MKIIDKSISFLIKIANRVLNFLVYVKRDLIKDKYDVKRQQDKVIKSTKYDMVSSPDEPYYRDQYWYWINKYINSNEMPSNGKYLDLGCGQGRLAMLLAKWCGKEGMVTGVDLSETAINKAKEYAEKEGLSNIEYYTKDIFLFLKSQKSESFDGIFFIEVAFFMPEYFSILKEVRRILKPRALFFSSFRSQYFYLLNSINKHNWEDTDMIINRRMGNLGGGDLYFTWQTSSEIRQLMEDELKLKVLDLCGIGCCSGIEGDPHSYIARPSYLNKEEKNKLMKVEIILAKNIVDAGRYILCIAKNK